MYSLEPIIDDYMVLRCDLFSVQVEDHWHTMSFFSTATDIHASVRSWFLSWNRSEVGPYPFTLPTDILLLNHVSDSINKVNASLFNTVYVTGTLEYCNTTF